MNAAIMPNTSKQPGGRRRDPNYKQLNLNLPPELIKKLRVQAVKDEVSISALAERIFEEWFSKGENQW
jgi:predicted HicB family RNase H-like nuclease